MIRVLVASESPVMQAGLESLLASGEDLTVSGHARGLSGLAERIEELQPDVVLLETGSRGDDVQAFLASVPGAPPLVVLTDEAGMTFINAGARGVLPPTATGPEIVGAIQATAAGLIVMHPEALESAAPGSLDGVLTAREIEVLRMMAGGLANKEIAYRLGISEHTVKFHVASLFGKLHASSRTEAVTLGIRQGLIML